MCHVAERLQAQLGIADGTWVAELCGLLDQVGAELTHDPAEMDIHRRDLDRANGVPNRAARSPSLGCVSIRHKARMPEAG